MMRTLRLFTTGCIFIFLCVQLLACAPEITIRFEIENTAEDTKLIQVRGFLHYLDTDTPPIDLKTFEIQGDKPNIRNLQDALDLNIVETSRPFYVEAIACETDEPPAGCQREESSFRGCTCQSCVDKSTGSVALLLTLYPKEQADAFCPPQCFSQVAICEGK
jgi:hypothetical protein